MGVIDGIEAEARTITTDGPESDGTLEWTDTTIVLARVRAGGETGTAVGLALHDVKPRLLEVPVAQLLGRARAAVSICGDRRRAPTRRRLLAPRDRPGLGLEPR